MSVFEVNFDGLVGPSHHYAGLSKGNIASEKNAMAAANRIMTVCFERAPPSSARSSPQARSDRSTPTPRRPSR